MSVRECRARVADARALTTEILEVDLALDGHDDVFPLRPACDL